MCVVDATIGGGGHAREMTRMGANVIGLDRDPDAIKSLNQNEFELHNTTFSSIEEILGERKVNAIIADLGVSSHQIDTPERGFSYMVDAPIDMRMNKNDERSAYDIVNKTKQDDLEKIIREYGEENYAGRIARCIVESRPISTTGQLASIISRAVPASYGKAGGHPAKRTFQGIRIAVNNELEEVKNFIYSATKCLTDNGKLAIISFHSLEDRIVKHAFRDLARTCICPSRVTHCVCNHKPNLHILTAKPILPTQKEISLNPRSSSAKLRVAQKIGG